MNLQTSREADIQTMPQTNVCMNACGQASMNLHNSSLSTEDGRLPERRFLKKFFLGGSGIAHGKNNSPCISRRLALK